MKNEEFIDGDGGEMTEEVTNAEEMTDTDQAYNEPEGEEESLAEALTEEEATESDEEDTETTEADDEDAADDSETTSDESDEYEEYEDGYTEEPDSEESPALPEHHGKDKKKVEKPRRIDSLFDFIEIFVFTLAAVFIVTSFFFRYSIVDGASMENTLYDQEKLLLTNFLYEPKPGDVVVVQDKSTLLQDPIVKRVIAVGGQTVKFTHTAVYVDGVKLDEPYVLIDNCKEENGNQYTYSVYPSDALAGLVIGYEPGVYYEIRVPEGEIFVMGDHRDNSTDSRKIGTLHEDAIIGKVVLRFSPFSKFGKIE